MIGQITSMNELFLFVVKENKSLHSVEKIIDTVGRAKLLTHSESHVVTTEEIQEENIKLTVHGVTKAGQLNNVISSGNFRSIRIFLKPVVID